MRSVSIRLADLAKATIPVGFAGENLHTQVRIDCLKIFEEYPDALATLTVQPPEGEPYPTIVTRDGDEVVWDVTNSDLIHEGKGELQLSFVENEVVVKSYVGQYRVLKSILPSGEIPDPIDDWITRAEAALADIPHTINEALEEAKESGEFDGFSPIATVTKEDKVTTISITDVNGTTTASIKDPEYTDLIDDTADAGVLDKTWSADKLTSEFDLKAPKANPEFTGTFSLGRAEGTTVGFKSIAIGSNVTASGYMAYAEGAGTTASGSNSHTEGVNTKATSNNAHAENDSTTASGMDSHAEGTASVAAGYSSHAENIHNTASGQASHAEGMNNTAKGSESHAEGRNTLASGDMSHVEGDGTIAAGSCSTVFGKFNISDSYDDLPDWAANTSYAVGDKVKRTIEVTTFTGKELRTYGYVCKTANNDSTFNSDKWTSLNGIMHFVEIVGNGTEDNTRSNAYALDWNGTGRFGGDVYVNCDNDSTGGTKLATMEDVPEVATLQETQAIIDEYETRVGA